MDEDKPFESTDFYSGNITGVKKLLGLLLADIFLHPGQFNLIRDVQFVFQGHASVLAARALFVEER